MPLLAQHPTPMRQGVSTDSVYQLTRSAVIPIHFGRFDTTWAEIYRDSTVIYAGNVRRIVINSTGIRTIGTNIPDTLRIGNGAKLDSAYVSSDTLKFRVGSVWYSAYKNNPVDTIAVAGIASKAALQDTAAALRASIGSGGGGTNPTKQQALNTLNAAIPDSIALLRPLTVSQWVGFNGANTDTVRLGNYKGDSTWVYVPGLTSTARIVASYNSNGLLTVSHPVSIGNVQTNGFSVYGDSGKYVTYWIITGHSLWEEISEGPMGGYSYTYIAWNTEQYRDSLFFSKSFIKQVGDSSLKITVVYTLYNMTFEETGASPQWGHWAADSGDVVDHFLTGAYWGSGSQVMTSGTFVETVTRSLSDFTVGETVKINIGFYAQGESADQAPHPTMAMTWYSIRVERH